MKKLLEWLWDEENVSRGYLVLAFWVLFFVIYIIANVLKSCGIIFN